MIFDQHNSKVPLRRDEMRVYICLHRHDNMPRCHFQSCCFWSFLGLNSKSIPCEKRVDENWLLFWSLFFIYISTRTALFIIINREQGNYSVFVLLVVVSTPTLDNLFSIFFIPTFPNSNQSINLPHPPDSCCKCLHFTCEVWFALKQLWGGVLRKFVPFWFTTSLEWNAI